MKSVDITISEYNQTQIADIKSICDLLYLNINKSLKNSNYEIVAKVWHGSPVWFINGNLIVSYSVRKNKSISLMFFSGQSFEEEGLKPLGKFKAAEILYTDPKEIKLLQIKRWLVKSIKIQWDYKNILKMKGKLIRLM